MSFLFTAKRCYLPLFGLVGLVLGVCLIWGCTFGTFPTSPLNHTSSVIQVKPLHITPYFCQTQDCQGVLYGAFSNATTSIHCAFFSFSIPDLMMLLEQKYDQGLDVRVVMDGDNMVDLSSELASYDTRSAFMHDKFCIIDGSIVITGSYNPTPPTAKGLKQDNNVVIYTSVLIARGYEEEFQSFLQKRFGRDEKTPGDPDDFDYHGKEFDDGNASLSIYFCPEDSCAYHVAQELSKANASIYFMTYSFTHVKIANVLISKHHDGVVVEGVMEKSQNSKYSAYNIFVKNGISVLWDANPALLHHKVFIIDNRTVITGSFNPSSNADKNNDENVLVIRNDDVAWAFLQEFARVQGLAQEKALSSLN